MSATIEMYTEARVRWIQGRLQWSLGESHNRITAALKVIQNPNATFEARALAVGRMVAEEVYGAVLKAALPILDSTDEELIDSENRIDELLDFCRLRTEEIEAQTLGILSGFPLLAVLHQAEHARCAVSFIEQTVSAPFRHGQHNPI